jgi:hypothetical protein
MSVSIRPAEAPDTAEEIVLRLSRHMQVLADKGEWAELEQAALRLRGEILDIPEADRHSVLIALQESAAAVSTKARSAHEDVSGKLTALRRGRAATEAYKLR